MVQSVNFWYRYFVIVIKMVKKKKDFASNFAQAKTQANVGSKKDCFLPKKQ